MKTYRILVAILVGTALVYGFTATRSTLWDRDEPRNAYAAVEMDRTGNYLYPTIKGEVRAHKPILAYWMMIPSMKLFGQTEFAVRLPAILGTLLAMSFTFLMGRRIASTKVALLAAALLPACPLVIATGATATTDGLLLGGIVMTFYALAVLCIPAAREDARPPTQSSTFLWVLLLLAGLTFAQFAKGPVGIAIPALAMLAYGIWTLRDRTISRVCFLLMIAMAILSVGFFMMWVIPADIATEGAFISEGFKKHVVERAQTPMESHGGTSLLYAFFYPFTLLFSFFPFTLYLPVAITALCGGRLFPKNAARFLGAWIIVTLAMMTLVATKLPHYVLPCFPALILMVAAVPFPSCGGVPEGRGGLTISSADRRALAVGRWIFIVPCMVIAFTLMFAPWSVPLLRLPVTLDIPFTARLAASIAGIVLGGTGLFAFVAQKRGRHLTAILATAAMILLLYLTFSIAIAPAVEPYKLSRPICKLVRDSVPPDILIGHCGYNEPTLYFYLPPETHVVNVSGHPEKLREFLEGPDRPGLIIREQEFQRFRDAFPDLPLHIYGKIHGLNYTKGKKTDVYFVRVPSD